jgi:hypothetical protein
MAPAATVAAISASNDIGALPLFCTAAGRSGPPAGFTGNLLSQRRRETGMDTEL